MKKTIKKQITKKKVIRMRTKKYLNKKNKIGDSNHTSHKNLGASIKNIKLKGGMFASDEYIPLGDIQYYGPGEICKIEGLKECLGVVFRNYNEEGKLIGIVGGHFVTNKFIEFQNKDEGDYTVIKLTEDGLEFVNTINNFNEIYGSNTLEIYHRGRIGKRLNELYIKEAAHPESYPAAIFLKDIIWKDYQDSKISYTQYEGGPATSSEVIINVPGKIRAVKNKKSLPNFSLNNC